MRIDDLTGEFTAKQCGKDDIEDILSLCVSNPQFYRYHPPFVSKESIIDDMKALPPAKTMDDKFYLGFYRGDELIAIMDLILGYPDAQTAFIGFFMVHANNQKQGIGSRIIEHCVHALKQAGFLRIRLGIDQGNSQSERFWIKQRFVKTGEVCMLQHTAILPMERLL